MRKTFYLFLLFLSFFTGSTLSGADNNSVKEERPNIASPDSLRERQFLYNGTEWKNQFRRIAGDQFLFTNIFLPGSITFNGKTFVNVLIRYDIYSDEIMIPRSLDQIIRLNKEMVDSFYYVFDNSFYKFIKINESSPLEPRGYVNVLYNDISALYVKYEKRITTAITDKSDGEFYLVYTIYFVKNGIPMPVSGFDDICNILKNEASLLRKFVKENSLKVSRKVPQSFVPVIRYYDSLSNK